MLKSATLRKLARSHLRLWLAIVAGVVVFALLPPAWAPGARLLVSWNCAVLLFLALFWQWMLHLPADLMRSRFAEEDETAGVILLIVTLSALLSLVAIFALLGDVKHLQGSARGAYIALAAITVMSSWTLVPTMYSVHYANRYYSSKPERRPLGFPQTAQPDFWDFIYFSFTIAVACQTADVCTNTTAIRRTTIGHAVVSFIFNASILGFAINISAGLVGAS